MGGDNKIHYHVVDEYEGIERNMQGWENDDFIISPKPSQKPFTFDEMVSFINNIGIKGEGQIFSKHLTIGMRDEQYDPGQGRRDLEDLIGFVRVSSLFYTELESWYDAEALEWLSARLAELGLENLN